MTYRFYKPGTFVEVQTFSRVGIMWTPAIVRFMSIEICNGQLVATCNCGWWNGGGSFIYDSLLAEQVRPITAETKKQQAELLLRLDLRSGNGFVDIPDTEYIFVEEGNMP